MREAGAKHQLQQFLVETQVADAVHGDKFHFAVRKLRDQTPAQLFKRALVVRKVVVFKINDAVTLLITKFNLLQDVIQLTQAVIVAKRGVDGAKGTFVRATARSDHEREGFTCETIGR